ncbi:MAG: hypothetical protein NZ899_05490 [Thermoguttaceae bacterium]|nr:hypothetical protein [Thermoguttaceae bacterium]MDW8078231.1 hypothetical protein [Thermoguttaceae bacterium]
MARPLETSSAYPQGEPLEVLLSAYLDGELDEASSRQVEVLLATDPEARRLLRQLEETWGMLDLLERTDADPGLTRTTLEMVAVAAEEEVARQRRELPWRRAAQVALAFALLAAATLAGFFWSAFSRRQSQEAILREWPLLEHLDQYEQIGQWEFLQLLDTSELFAEEQGPRPDEPR